MDWREKNYSGGDTIDPVKIHDTFTPWLDQYAQKPKKMRSIVQKNALEIEAKSKATAPVDKGALKGGMMAEEKVFSIGSIIWEIHDSVHYGVHQELGTSRGVPALHFLGRAAEQQDKKFFADIAKELKE